jgi:hypothetical protein
MLMSVCDLQGDAVNNPDEFDWSNIPPRFVLAMHWHPTNQLLELLEKEQFKVVTLFRHPFDILVSILQFTFNQPTHRWLEGAGGSENSIYGAMPRSEVFLRYARSPRAEALLSVATKWATIPGVHKVSYEALVHNTATEMNRLLDALGIVSSRSLDSVIEANTMDRATSSEHPLHYNFWQGKPDHWKKFLTSVEANTMAQYLEPFLSACGYRCDPDLALTSSQADANWVALCGTKVVETLRQKNSSKMQIESYEAQITSLRDQLASTRAESDNLRQAILRDSRGVRRIKSVIRTVANFFVPLGPDSKKEQAA